MKQILITVTLLIAFFISKAQQQGTTKQDSIYTVVDVAPVFGDGMSYFYQYLMENINYPEKDIRKGTHGKAYVTFVVEKDGSLTDIKVLRGLSKEIDAEAIKALKKAPNWQPGLLDGKPVRSQYSMAIDFKLPPQPSMVGQQTGDSVKVTFYPSGQTETVYTKVEQEPTPIGGMAVFYLYLARNIHYPLSAKLKNIQGVVFLTFIIEPDGDISNVRIFKGVSPDINAEAVRVISNAPKWNPGIKNGKPVRVLYNVPISFKLQNN